MLQLKPQNIIPITKARGQLDDLVTQAIGTNFYAISRQGRTTTALIDLNYLLDLQQRLDSLEMQTLDNQLKQSFKRYLKSNKLDPNTVSDTQAEQMLTNLSYDQPPRH